MASGITTISVKESHGRTTGAPHTSVIPLHPIFGKRLFICAGNDLCCQSVHVSSGWDSSIFLTVAFAIAIVLMPTSVIDYQSAQKRGQLPGWIVATVVVELLAALSLTNLWLCVCVEPGIIPPSTYYTETEEGKKQLKANGGSVELPSSGNSERSVFVESTHINNNNGASKIEWTQVACTACKIWRPPRSGHCWRNNVCVREFDHFCGVTGSLVGERNFRFFTMFNQFTGLMGGAIIVVTCAALALLNDYSQLSSSHLMQWRVAASVIVLLLAVIGGGFAFTFAIRYSYFACFGYTAKDLAGRYSAARAIADMQADECCAEFFSRLCSAMPESQGPYKVV